MSDERALEVTAPETRPYWLRVAVKTGVGKKSRTKQSFAAALDVNAIMKKYAATGTLPENSRGEPQYGDFSGVEDYLTSLNKIRAAEDRFAEMPSAVRDHCKNDPAELMAMVFDPERRGELEQLRLVKPKDPVQTEIPGGEAPEVPEKPAEPAEPKGEGE